jgi:hypothetical protein
MLSWSAFLLLSPLLIISLLFPSSFQVVRTRETTFTPALKKSISLPKFFYPATPYCPCMCHVDYDVLAIPLVTLFLSLCTMLFSCVGFLFFWCICMKFILHMIFLYVKPIALITLGDWLRFILSSCCYQARWLEEDELPVLDHHQRRRCEVCIQSPGTPYYFHHVVMWSWVCSL